MSSLELLTRAYGDVRFEVLKPTPFARPTMTLEEYIALRRSLYEDSPLTERREAAELEDTIEFHFDLGPDDEVEPETRREGR